MKELAMQNAIKQSAGLHLAIICLALVIGWVVSHSRPIRRQIKVTVLESPSAISKETQTPTVTLTQPPPKPIAVKPRAVFGLSRAAQTSEQGTVEVKAGNTLAKEIDQEKLKDDDPTSLPVPTEEYLVTQMPQLEHEVRVPYPPEAKAKNIEGAVVMDVLIDSTGQVRKAEVIEGPGYGLNEAALKAIYEFKFAAARIDQKPVAVRIRYAYRFVLH